MTKNTISIAEASSLLGAKRTSIRYYLNQGLVPHIRRDQNGHRVLEPWQVNLLQILLGMKQARFKPKAIRRYAQLFREGRSTEAERLHMLTTRKHQLRQEIIAHQRAIDFIERQEEIIWQEH